jgi:hypothetical protein
VVTEIGAIRRMAHPIDSPGSIMTLDTGPLGPPRDGSSRSLAVGEVPGPIAVGGGEGGTSSESVTISPR